MSIKITPKRWRLANRLSMAATAATVGVRGKNPARTWQRWENGECTPPLQVVVNIEELNGFGPNEKLRLVNRPSREAGRIRPEAFLFCLITELAYFAGCSR